MSPMQHVENQKLNLLKEAFSNFMEIPFPNYLNEDNQEKDPYGTLLYIDEDVAVAVLSWLEPSSEDENNFHKKRDLTEEINHAEKVIKNYKTKDKNEEEIIVEMLLYLNEIKQLHNVYLNLWKS